MRNELHCPEFDKALVEKLANIASRIDGEPESACDDLIAEFNQLSETETPFLHFQGVYGGDGHDEWVRNVLATRTIPTIVDLDRDDIIEAFETIINPETPNYQRCFLVDTLAQNLREPNVSDLIYWPDEYFADNQYDGRELSAPEMADIVLKYN